MNSAIIIAIIVVGLAVVTLVNGDPKGRERLYLDEDALERSHGAKSAGLQ